MEMSRSSNREESHQAIYFGLSTLRNKPREIVERLIDLACSTDYENAGRSRWGLSFGVSAEDGPLVTAGMQRLFEARSEPALQAELLGLIGQYATSDCLAWLRSASRAMQRSPTPSARPRAPRSPRCRSADPDARSSGLARERRHSPQLAELDRFETSDAYDALEKDGLRLTSTRGEQSVAAEDAGHFQDDDDNFLVAYIGPGRFAAIVSLVSDEPHAPEHDEGAPRRHRLPRARDRRGQHVLGRTRARGGALVTITAGEYLVLDHGRRRTGPPREEAVGRVEGALELASGDEGQPARLPGPRGRRARGRHPTCRHRAASSSKPSQLRDPIRRHAARARERAAGVERRAAAVVVRRSARTPCPFIPLAQRRPGRAIPLRDPARRHAARGQ